MNTSLFAQTNPVFAYPGGITPNGDGVTDFSGSNGLLVVPSATAGQLVIATSATAAVPVAVVLDGQPSNRQSNMLALTGGVVVRIQAGGAITQFTRVQLNASGQVVADAGAGNSRIVVGLALDAATAAGQLIRVATFTPVEYTTD